MNNSPDELARLAQQGQARLDAANRGAAIAANAAAERNIRTAIGPVRGAPVRRALLVLFVLATAGVVAGGASTGGGLRLAAALSWLMPAFFAAAGLLALYLLLPPLASRAGVEAERAWVASLPFALEHYFEVIGADPMPVCRIDVELWTARELDPRTLQGIIALFDTGSHLVEVRGTHVKFSTGPISGTTGIRKNRYNIYRNHRLGKVVHRLVDVVLLPIHRSDPIARVTLSRA